MQKVKDGVQVYGDNNGVWWLSKAPRGKFVATHGGATSAWSPVLAMKSVAGKWEIGTLTDDLYVNYYLDTRTTNGADKQYRFASNGNITTPGSITATSFIKSGSSSSYVLLGNGEHKLLTDIYKDLQIGARNFISRIPIAGGQTSVSGETVTISGAIADTYFYVKLLKPLKAGQVYSISCDVSAASGVYYKFPIGGQGNPWGTNTITLQNGRCHQWFIPNVDVAAGTNIILDDTTRNPGVMTITNIQIEEGYSCSSYRRAIEEWDSDTLDGMHAGQFIENGAWWVNTATHDANTLTNSSNFVYTTHSNVKTTGTMLTVSNYTNSGYRLQINSNYSVNELYYRNRNGNNGTWTAWTRILDASNSSVSKSGQTLTVKINNTTQSLTNTDSAVYQSSSSSADWRDLLLSYYSVTTDNVNISVSAATAQTYFGAGIAAQTSTGSIYAKGSYYGKESRFHNCLAYYNSTASQAVGAIVIQLPNSWNSTMICYEIDVYEYNFKGASKIICGGYNYTSSSSWVNTSVTVIGDYSFDVRFGYYNNKCCIILGAVDTTWSYPQVWLKSVETGFNHQTFWKGEYTISLITDNSLLTSINAPTVKRVAYQSQFAGLFTNLSNTSDNKISVTIGGTNKTLTVGYATNATNATKIYVNQHTTNNTNYPIVWSNQANSNTVQENQLYKSWDHFYYNPANKAVTAGRFISTVATGTQPYATSSTTLNSNLNADLLDGLHVHTGRNNEANKVVRTDGNGYIQAGWINTTSGNMGATSATKVYCSNDDYIRYKTITNFGNQLRDSGSLDGRWVLKAGDTMTGTLHMKPATGNYTEGIRFYGTAKDSTWSNVNFGCDPAATNGTHTNQWILGRNTSNQFVIDKGGSANTTFCINTDKNVGIGTGSPSYKLHVVGDIYANNGWLRTNGSRGWYNDTYGGGWYMSDSTWVRTYNNKAVVAKNYHATDWGSATYLLRSDGGAAAFNWSGQSGQPTWLWGGNSQHTYYVYNPSNFRVAYATSAGNADTVDGYHASGLFTNLSNSGNNISVTIGGTNKTLTVGFATNSSYTRYVTSPDTRNTAITPSSLATGVQFDFKSGSTIGLTSSSYSGVMTYRPFGSGSDWSGGHAHQIAYNDNGIYWRKNTDNSTWGDWKPILFICSSSGVSRSIPTASGDINKEFTVSYHNSGTYTDNSSTLSWNANDTVSLSVSGFFGVDCAGAAAPGTTLTLNFVNASNNTIIYSFHITCSVSYSYIHYSLDAGYSNTFSKKMTSSGSGKFVFSFKLNTQINTVYYDGGFYCTASKSGTAATISITPDKPQLVFNNKTIELSTKNAAIQVIGHADASQGAVVGMVGNGCICGPIVICLASVYVNGTSVTNYLTNAGVCISEVASSGFSSGVCIVTFKNIYKGLSLSNLFAVVNCNIAGRTSGVNITTSNNNILCKVSFGTTVGSGNTGGTYTSADPFYLKLFTYLYKTT